MKIRPFFSTITDNNVEINIQVVQKLVSRFKGKSARINNLLSDNEILRMAITASMIPIAGGPEAQLIDIGGTVFWLPIYSELLGYKKLVILSRPGGSFINEFNREEIGEDINVEIIACDAELSKYPLNDAQASCVVCFELLEHFAGDPMNVIAESNRILKDNGFFCLTTPNVLSQLNLAALALGQHPYSWSMFTDSFADRHNREYTPFEVRQLLEAGGFEIIQLQTFTAGNKGRLILRLFGYLLSCPASLARIVPFKMRNKLIFVLAKRAGPVLDRYPAFLYDLFGANKVHFKIPYDLAGII
jgi:SAM-dependent methyltransferase